MASDDSTRVNPRKFRTEKFFSLDLCLEEVKTSRKNRSSLGKCS